MIRDNIQHIRNEIAKACSQSGRNESEITLIAVSKNFPSSSIREAIEAGITDFGENKAREFESKCADIGDSVTWHFIGHLQTNKVKYVVKTADIIHSVDSVKLAAEIQKQAEKAGKVQNVLIEVKTSFEESKHGLAEEENIAGLAEFVKNQPNLALRGLMTIAPFVDDEKVIRESFRSLRLLRENLSSEGYYVPHLSMGMSGDFRIAIDEGATMIRVGTSIFGERVY